MSSSKEPLSTNLNKLTINPTATKKPSAPKVIADSWEDHASESEEDEDEEEEPPTPQAKNYPTAPPPTPITPAANQDFESPYGYRGSEGLKDGRDSGKRPEKTNAVASRLIAGALGVRAPPKTEEQKAYEKAVREKEVKRREREKEDAKRAEEERERAKKAIWDD